mmetsp:Transcript_30281/g.46367  ORF Transcript_30281/g.46367 Transcript_30281/m.46367 type:complete len:315 (-) Transcript_30281:304-1248(-)
MLLVLVVASKNRRRPPLQSKKESTNKSSRDCSILLAISSGLEEEPDSVTMAYSTSMATLTLTGMPPSCSSCDVPPQETNLPGLPDPSLTVRSFVPILVGKGVGSREVGITVVSIVGSMVGEFTGEFVGCLVVWSLPPLEVVGATDGANVGSELGIAVDGTAVLSFNIGSVSLVSSSSSVSFFPLSDFFPFADFPLVGFVVVVSPLRNRVGIILGMTLGTKEGISVEESCKAGSVCPVPSVLVDVVVAMDPLPLPLVALPLVFFSEVSPFDPLRMRLCCLIPFNALPFGMVASREVVVVVLVVVTTFCCLRSLAP